MTNAEKVRIVKQHTEDNIPLIDLGKAYGISPDQIYSWKRQLAEAAVSRRFLEAGLITRDQLRRGIVYQRANGGRTVDALIELGFLRPEKFVSFMVKQAGIPSLNLRNYTIDPAVAALVPADFAQERLALPIDRLGRLLTVAMACPLDDDTVREISTLTGLRTKPVFAEKGDIEWAIENALREIRKTGPASDAPVAIPPKPSPQELGAVPAPDIIKLIGQIQALPLVPGSMHLLRRAIDHDIVEEDTLVRTMMMDPLMATRLLALANAENFGQAGKISSLRQAVRLLGAEKACTLVSAADTVFLYGHWDHFHFQTYWTDALCCAKASSLLADRCGLGRLEDFYTAGLLHDVGRIALFEILPHHYAQTDPEATGIELLIQEREGVGMPHTEAGYELAVSCQSNRFFLPVKQV